MYEILFHDGLSVEILMELSYKSCLGVNLKKNLHYFDKEAMMEEISDIIEWYDNKSVLHSLSIDYRVKSMQSAIRKFNKNYPDHQARKVFDDLLGFRSLCDNYNGISSLKNSDRFRIADLTNGKSVDDGYRGVHAYFQMDNFCYPIEIQYNTYYDRQFNNWLHKYLYKKQYGAETGQRLRFLYDNGRIKNELEFTEALKNVLSCS